MIHSILTLKRSVHPVEAGGGERPASVRSAGRLFDFPRAPTYWLDPHRYSMSVSPMSAVGPRTKAPTFKTHLLRFFTWWSGATLNTRFYTSRHGEFVGNDEFGNAYYRSIGGAIDPALGFDRRWVIYAGESEGSATPPGWYGWLRHLTDEVPTPGNYVPREWEKAYLPNMTGTAAAYRPAGSVLRTGQRPATGGDYDAWTPN